MIPTAQAPPEPASSVTLVDRVEAVRLDRCRFLMARAALWAFTVLLIVCGLLALADWIWLLSPSLRLAAWQLLGLAAVALFCRRILLPRRPFGVRETAAEIETSFPQLGQRICTTLEYVKPTPQTMPAWPSLVRALMSDTEQRTAGLTFDRVVPWRRLRGPGAAAAGLAGAFLIMLLVSPEARIAAMRLFLIPAHYTQLRVEPGDQTVKAGADLTVRAILSGRPVASVALVYRKAGSEDQWTEVSLGSGDDEDAGGRPRLLGTLETTLKGCQDDLDYRVVAGPVESPTFRLTVLHPLVLRKIEATIEPPAYTRQKTTVVTEADLRVIEGSRVRLRFTLDRAPQAAALRRLAAAPPDGKAALPAAPVPPLALDVQGNVLTRELASVTAPAEYELQAEAADGMRLEPRRLRIQVQPDRKPTIRFVKPRGEIEVTPTTEVTMQVEADDDFGLSKVGIVYQVGSGPKKTLRLDEDSKQPVSLTTLATLHLEENPLTYQDSVTYYAFAEDNYPSGPHRVTTELGFIDIRPYKRAYQVLKTGGT